jgi:protoporphyrin/coproporphyrin ferrochelatase
VLLINLGTPEAPSAPAVRAYLKAFLSDPRVVEIPRLVWWPVLRLFVLTTRPRASARRYAQIWLPEGSPLKVYTARQATLLRGYLGERLGADVAVDYAMRYGSPSIPEQLRALCASGCERILLLPLYPQYSASTSATAFDAAFSALACMRAQPEVRTVRDFHDDPGHIEALAKTVREHWARHGRGEVLVMSFHGVPRHTVELGDPYYAQCRTSAARLAAALKLAPQAWRLTFQSRFGVSEWLQPYTADTLAALGREKRSRIDVICPGFVCDCLETLEEIAIEGREIYTEAGGGEFSYIACLNDRHEWLEALCQLASRNLLGWVEDARSPASDASALRRSDTGTNY